MNSKLSALTFMGLILLITICYNSRLQNTPFGIEAHPTSASSNSPAIKDDNGEIANRKQASVGAKAQYHFDVWTTDNGLPQNSVSSILQTRDGVLLLTTNNGPVRYDVVSLTNFNASNTKGLKKRDGRRKHSPNKGRYRCSHLLRRSPVRSQTAM